MHTLNQAYRISGMAGRAMERLSTGLKINRGEDDPSGLGIAEQERAQIRGTNVAIHNTEESIKFYNMRDSYMEEMQQMVHRIRDLAVRSANEATLTDDQRAIMQDEVTELMEQINIRAAASQMIGGSSRLLLAPTKLDVIWVVDATFSMTPLATALRDGAGMMYDKLKQSGFDLRMNVTPFADPFWCGDDIFQSHGADSVSWAFQRDTASFVADVDEVIDMIGGGSTGGTERGLTSVSETLDNGSLGGAFRTEVGSKRVVILLTDEDSDDWGGGASDQTADMNAASVAARAALVAKLAAADVTMHAVGRCRYEGTPAQRTLLDEDYGEVATASGGQAINLPNDNDTTWVDTITNTLMNADSPFLGYFQVGPDNDNSHMMTETFNSVTCTSMGLTSANVSTASQAQDTITIADDAINWLSDERALTGITVKRLQHITNDLNQMNIGNSEFRSGLADADMHEEIVKLTISQVLNDTVTAAQAHANVNTESASEFLAVVEQSEQVDRFGAIFTVQAMM